MLVIVLENAPKRLHGYLTRLLVELKFGVYVGDFSIKVREKVNNVIVKEIESGSAIMVWSTNNDIGFSLKIFGNSKYLIKNFDGLNLMQTFPFNVGSKLKSVK